MSRDSLEAATSRRELRLEFEEIFAYEAELLDESRLTEWLELLDDDIRYRVPARIDEARGVENLNQPGLLCHFDDDKRTLSMRAKRLEAGGGYADDPPPRTRHIVSNVRVVRAESGFVELSSNFVVFRSHVGLPDHLLTGARRDRWVGKPGTWRLRERLVVLDQNSFQGMAVLF